jgi:hypothetical protein
VELGGGQESKGHSFCGVVSLAGVPA